MNQQQNKIFRYVIYQHLTQTFNELFQDLLQHLNDKSPKQKIIDDLENISVSLIRYLTLTVNEHAANDLELDREFVIPLLIKTINTITGETSISDYVPALKKELDKLKAKEAISRSACNAREIMQASIMLKILDRLFSKRSDSNDSSDPEQTVIINISSGTLSDEDVKKLDSLFNHEDE